MVMMMVEDSKKRGRGGQRGGHAHHTPATAAAAHAASLALAAAAVPPAADCDGFAAFTSKYRDVLRFADAEEAEAVFSMVALTQAGRQQQRLQGTVVRVPESRAVKRRAAAVAATVPTASACSEDGCSDSSAKSAPGPAPLRQQHWQPYAAWQPQQQQLLPGSGDIHPGALGPAPQLAGGGGAACSSMPQLPAPGGCFFPQGMPLLPPWPLPAGMMPPMMFGGLMPPLPQPLRGAFIAPPASTGRDQQEPAAGIPVRSPLPLPPLCGLVCGIPMAAAVPQLSRPMVVGLHPPAAAGCVGSAAPATPSAGAAGAAPSPVLTPATTAGVSSPVLQPPPPQQQQQQAAEDAGAVAAQPGSRLLAALEQLDLPGVRQQVLAAFGEPAWLLLLDAWRPDSPRVHEAIWAWRLHVRGRPDPDVRSMLVSLFGLQRLTQLAASAAQAPGPAGAPAPAALQQPAMAVVAAAAAAATEGDEERCDVGATNSNLSSDPGATLVALGPHVASSLLPLH